MADPPSSSGTALKALTDYKRRRRSPMAQPRWQIDTHLARACTNLSTWPQDFAGWSSAFLWSRRRDLNCLVLSSTDKTSHDRHSKDDD